MSIGIHKINQIIFTINEKIQPIYSFIGINIIVYV